MQVEVGGVHTDGTSGLKHINSTLRILLPFFETTHHPKGHGTAVVNTVACLDHGALGHQEDGYDGARGETKHSNFVRNHLRVIFEKTECSLR